MSSKEFGGQVIPFYGGKLIIVDNAGDDEFCEARRLLSFYFGDEVGNSICRPVIEYKVVAYT